MRKSRVSQKIFKPQYQVGRNKNILVRSDANLDASVCLLPSFLIYVSLKRLFIDGASIVMSMLNT